MRGQGDGQLELVPGPNEGVARAQPINRPSERSVNYLSILEF